LKTQPEPSPAPRSRLWLFQPGSLSRRLLIVALIWIGTLLLGGGVALDRIITNALVQAYDAQLSRTLQAMIGAAELGPDGEIRYSRAPGDQRFFEPYSGLYWQVSSASLQPWRSRSLWDRALTTDLAVPRPAETLTTRLMWNEERLRIAERDVQLPGAKASMRFMVAARVDELETQVGEFRRTLVWSLGALGAGLLLITALQVTVGLRPLRAVRQGLENIRSGASKRLDQDFPPEVQPLVGEMNALLDHQDAQAEQARTHAGNLAHALKTPMAVLLNEGRAGAGELAQTVVAQTEAMQRHVNHHLARARAIGRRASIATRAPLLPTLEALKRVLERVYGEQDIAIALSIPSDLAFRGEKQDLDEMLGNLVDNACKYGGGKVRVTARRDAGEPMLTLLIEDNGPGIPDENHDAIFGRGVRLDESAPGTGLGLAIVRDIASIYGGSVTLGRSVELGGLLVDVRLPAADGR
jgi:signal transduction histidine kinase